VCIVIDLSFGKNHLLYITWIANTFIPFYQHINYVDTLHKIFGLFFNNVYLISILIIYAKNLVVTFIYIYICFFFGSSGHFLTLIEVW